TRATLTRVGEAPPPLDFSQDAPPTTLGNMGVRKLRPVKLNITKLRAEPIFMPADEYCDDRRAD
ncbi:MAG: hypothetical protein WCD65_04880, partial [Pseudolabrys sp.]